MGMGSPFYKIQEYDLSQYIPGFQGVTGAIVIDSEKGEVDKLYYITSEKQFIETFGKPNPKKYGVYAYSALKFLEKSSSLFVVRVNRGQLYASALVRAKKYPNVYRDIYGYLLEEPKIDPIVKPNGALTKTDIETFQFKQYERKREVESFNPSIHLADLPLNGATKFYVDNIEPVNVGDYITFKNTNDLTKREEIIQYQYYKVIEKDKELVTQHFIKLDTTIPDQETGTPIKVVLTQIKDTGLVVAEDTAKDSSTIKLNDLGDLAVGDEVNFGDNKETPYKITDINADDKKITIDPALKSDVAKDTKVYRKIENVMDYAKPTALIYVDGVDQTIVRVTDNDIIGEGDTIEINGYRAKVVSKFNLQNYMNYIKVDTAYFDQTNAKIGDEIYHVTKLDFEHHDALLVWSVSPGEFGNKIAIAIEDNKDYAPAFNLKVYEDGELVEEFVVSMDYFIDGYGRQIQIEEVVNNQSRYIRVKVNHEMKDENGNLIEPLHTTYYLRQRVKDPNYNIVAKTTETIWDGDNYIRIRPEDVKNIDVTKPLYVFDRTYSIAKIAEGIKGSKIFDTIILEEAIDLSAMKDKLPTERYLPVGTELKQTYSQVKKVEVTIPNFEDKVEYKLVISNPNIPNSAILYSVDSTSKSLDEVLNEFVEKINSDENNILVNASTDGSVLHLVGKVAGVDYKAESDNMKVVEIQPAVRPYIVYPVEKIDGNILPTTTLGAIVTDGKVSYIIRDAGANRCSGGDDGEYPTIGQFMMALDRFRNPDEVDILLLLDGGFTQIPYQQELVKIAEKRKDCIALLSVSYEAQANPDIQAVVKYRQDLGINSSYGALYAPWVKVYDKYNDMYVMISPDGFASQAVSYVSDQRELWFPPAGWTNGKILISGLGRVYSKEERDLLYDNQINAIRKHPTKGYSIWGQKNLQATPSALDRINVRMLLIVIERALMDLLDNTIFELNTPSTQARLKSIVDSFLNSIKARGGLYGFTTICDDSNNTPQVIAEHKLYIDVYVQPTQAIEYPIGRVIITQKGAQIQPLGV